MAQLVDEDLGLPLHQAVEGAKVRMSNADADRVTLRAIELDLPITRGDFVTWIGEDLDAIDRVLDDVLARAGIAAAEVDRVVRDRLAARFGDGKLVGGEELTSVASGLAARAREVFG